LAKGRLKVAAAADIRREAALGETATATATANSKKRPKKKREL
jgi:hypothetical protein